MRWRDGAIRYLSTGKDDLMIALIPRESVTNTDSIRPVHHYIKNAGYFRFV